MFFRCFFNFLPRGGALPGALFFFLASAGALGAPPADGAAAASGAGLVSPAGLAFFSAFAFFSGAAFFSASGAGVGSAGAASSGAGLVFLAMTAIGVGASGLKASHNRQHPTTPALVLAGRGLGFGETRVRNDGRASYPSTRRPMLRAVPATMRAACSTSRAFRSAILALAISVTWAIVTLKPLYFPLFLVFSSPA